ncbi:MAG: hypothetical protein ABH846_02760 [Patescibacteria group bacterium]
MAPGDFLRRIYKEAPYLAIILTGTGLGLHFWRNLNPSLAYSTAGLILSLWLYGHLFIFVQEEWHITMYRWRTRSLVEHRPNRGYIWLVMLFLAPSIYYNFSSLQQKLMGLLFTVDREAMYAVSAHNQGVSLMLLWIAFLIVRLSLPRLLQMSSGSLFNTKTEPVGTLFIFIVFVIGDHLLEVCQCVKDIHVWNRFPFVAKRLIFACSL